jgi:predicted ATP-binding protein involved in virulence
MILHQFANKSQIHYRGLLVKRPTIRSPAARARWEAVENSGKKHYNEANPVVMVESLTMRLKPVRFIGHKIGPFDHIELNWEKDSRYTLIVAENGLGKTTLVAAMAACLSFGDDNLFPTVHFQRFGHDDETFAYFELDRGGKTAWILRWMPQTQASHRISLHTEPRLKSDSFLHLETPYDIPETRTIQLPDLPVLKEAIFIEGKTLDGGPRNIQTACSQNMISIIVEWLDGRKITTLAAGYGVSRDLQRPKIQEQQDLGANVLKNILNPFASIESSEIFQWVANQHIYYALALTEHKSDEAQAYLAAIQRVEQLLNEGLEYPITFQVKRNPFRLEVKQDGVTLTVDQLSDGTRSFLSWPLDYLMRASQVNWADPADGALAPGLILVDEIDVHLHPEWQRRVMQAIPKLLPQTYVIATTHSPFVLGAAEEAQVFRIRQDEQGRLFAQTDLDPLYGYPADLVLEKAFVPSLYAPEFEDKLTRLSELASQVAAGTVSPQEKQEHDALLRELARVNPWLNNLLALSQTKGPST